MKALALLFAALAMVDLAWGEPVTKSPPENEIQTIRQTQCLSNLHQIGQSLMLYATDHKGHYPADLGTLVAAGDLDVSLIICPATENSLPKNWKTMPARDKAQWVDEHTDYVYLRRSINDNGEQPLVYDRDDNHPRIGMNILFNDGHLESLSLVQARRKLGENAGAERTTTRIKPAPDQPTVHPLIRLEEAKTMTAKLDLSTLSVAIEAFEIDNGRYPTTEEGIKALLEKPAKAESWAGPYLKTIPSDPWTRPYHYVLQGDPPRFQVFSSGPDGKPGTADDVKE